MADNYKHVSPEELQAFAEQDPDIQALFQQAKGHPELLGMGGMKLAKQFDDILRAKGVVSDNYHINPNAAVSGQGVKIAQDDHWTGIWKPLAIGGAALLTAGLAAPALAGAGGAAAAAGGGTAAAGAGAAGTAAGVGGAASTLGTIGSIVGTGKKVADVIGAVGKGIGSATTAAANNRINSENAYDSRSKLEEQERRSAMSDIYRASQFKNPTFSPYDPNPPKTSPELLSSMSTMEQQAMQRLPQLYQYGAEKLPAPTPGTMEKIGNVAGPALSVGSTIFDILSGKNKQPGQPVPEDPYASTFDMMNTMPGSY